MHDLKKFLRPYHLIFDFKANPDKIKLSHPLAWENFIRLHYLYQKIIATKSIEKQKNIIAEWLSVSSPQTNSTIHLYDQFHEAIKSAKSFLEQNIREFIPDIYRFKFTSDGLVRPTYDPIELLNIIWNPPGNTDFSEIRCFEALIAWHLGIRFLLMKLHNSNKENMRNITLWLETELFENGCGSEKQQSLNICFDPTNQNRFSGFSPRTNSASLEYPVYNRIIDAQGEKIKVLYDGREKNPGDVFRKTLLQNHAHLPIVGDGLGIMLVFFSEEELEKAYDVIVKKIFPNSGALVDFRINGIGAKKANPNSANQAFPHKHFMAHTKFGLLEVQVFTFENYFNRRFSLGDENHHLYRIKQLIPLFELIYPKSLYLDWQDPNVKNLLLQFQKNRIKINFT